MAAPPMTHKNRSFLVKGNSENLSYDIGSLEPAVKNNVWELWVSSVSVQQKTPKSVLVGLKSNLVLKSSYLALFSLQDKDPIQTIFIPETWYEFDYVADTFELYLVDLITGKDLALVDTTFFVHIIFHRKA